MSAVPPGERPREEHRAPLRIRKNATEQVQIELSEYHGHQLVSLRVWWTPDDGTTWHPSKRGFALRVEVLPELLGALTALEADARRRGLLGEADEHPRTTRARARQEARLAPAAAPLGAIKAPFTPERTT